ncbi:MAG: hypothetical protein IJU98_03510 [Synergistaceae bacterium]|nr:hypothetical protein [Synergistaceae bacterium]
MPRLKQREEALEIAGTENQEERLEVVEEPEPVEQPKRKRGRPKKVRTPEELEAAEHPKKRGRPKKIRTPEEIEAAAQPKKRGRPRKVTEEPESPAVSSPDPATLDMFPEPTVESASETPEPVASEPQTELEPPVAPSEMPSEETPASEPAVASAPEAAPSAPEPEAEPQAEPAAPDEPSAEEVPVSTPEAEAGTPEPSPQDQEFALKYDTSSSERYVDSTSLKTQFEKVLEELAKISKDMLSWEVEKFTNRFTKKYVGEGMTLEEANAQKFEAFLGGFITNAAMDLYDRGYKDAAFHKLEQAINVLEARKKLEDEVESIKTRNEEDVVDLSDMLGLFVGDA